MRRIDCCQLFWLFILAIGGALVGVLVDITAHEGNSCKFILLFIIISYRETYLER